MPLGIVLSSLEILTPAPLSLDQTIDNFVSPIATAISGAVFWLSLIHI